MSQVNHKSNLTIYSGIITRVCARRAFVDKVLNGEIAYDKVVRITYFTKFNGRLLDEYPHDISQFFYLGDRVKFTLSQVINMTEVVGEVLENLGPENIRHQSSVIECYGLIDDVLNWGSIGEIAHLSIPTSVPGLMAAAYTFWDKAIAVPREHRPYKMSEIFVKGLPVKARLHHHNGQQQVCSIQMLDAWEDIEEAYGIIVSIAGNTAVVECSKFGDLYLNQKYFLEDKGVSFDSNLIGRSLHFYVVTSLPEQIPKINQEFSAIEAHVTDECLVRHPHTAKPKGKGKIFPDEENKFDHFSTIQLDDDPSVIQLISDSKRSGTRIRIPVANPAIGGRIYTDDDFIHAEDSSLNEDSNDDGDSDSNTCTWISGGRSDNDINELVNGMANCVDESTGADVNASTAPIATSQGLTGDFIKVINHYERGVQTEFPTEAFHLVKDFTHVIIHDKEIYALMIDRYPALVAEALRLLSTGCQSTE